MFGIIKKMVIVLLTSMVNASNHKKCVFLINQICEIQPTLINLHPMSQKLHYFTIAVKSDRSAESCNTLNDLSNKVCVPNKIEDPNICF